MYFCIEWVHVHVLMDVCVCVLENTCVSVCVCVSVCARVFICVYLFVWVCECVRSCVGVYVYVCMYVCMLEHVQVYVCCVFREYMCVLSVYVLRKVRIWTIPELLCAKWEFLNWADRWEFLLCTVQFRNCPCAKWESGQSENRIFVICFAGKIDREQGCPNFYKVVQLHIRL